MTRASSSSLSLTGDARGVDINKQVAQIQNDIRETWEKNGRWSKFYDIYKSLHENPGLSGQEFYAANSARTFLTSVKEDLEQQGPSSNLTLHIQNDIGKNESGPNVVGVLFNSGQTTTKNGAHRFAAPTPVVLLRADIDGLPVAEETGAAYQSKVEGVMHACGHDMHATTLMAAIQMLVESSDLWSGTVIACFQPCEENGKGAQAMVDAGLYGTKYGIPAPQYVYGAHVTPELAGTVSLTHGTAYSRSDSWKVTLTGKGGHASRPEACIDPIVMAAYAITRLQTVVSRRVPSQDAGVLTVGQISGGDAVNVIPETVTMKINVRSSSNDIYKLINSEMRNILAKEVQASDPDAKPDTSGEEPERESANPRFERLSSLPLLENMGPITDDIASVFTEAFQSDFIDKVPGVSGSEDFPNLAKSSKTQEEPDIPYCYWRYGSTSKEDWDAAGQDPNKVPSNHSKYFLPQLDIEKKNDTLKVGTAALFVAALSKCLLSPASTFVLVKKD